MRVEAPGIHASIDKPAAASVGSTTPRLPFAPFASINSPEG